MITSSLPSAPNRYPGTITDINSDGTVAISYNDGDFEGSVRIDLVRPQQVSAYKQNNTTTTPPAFS